MNTQKQIFLIVVLFFTFTGACAAYTAVDLPIRAEDQTEWHFEESVERGALLFANNCRTCHGNAGEGGVGPPLSRDEFRNQDPIVLANNRNMIRRTVTCGRAGTAMPTWGQEAGGPLNSVQIEHIVDFLTAPADDEESEEGPNIGWIEAVEFAHNLNADASAIVGGDTLQTIAVGHKIGPDMVAELNGLEPTSEVAEDTRIQLPPNNAFPNGRTVRVLSDNQTVEDVANEFWVGAIAIAELNGIDYDLDPDSNDLFILVDGEQVPGLLPGDGLALPEGAVYVVQAENTVDSIAETHGISASALRSLNEDTLEGLADDEAIPHERTLVLPPNPVWEVSAGETYTVIATLHGIEEEDLLAINEGLDAEIEPAAGQRIELPEDATYIVQDGDTLESVADSHAITAEELVSFNDDLEVGDPIGSEVILQLPEIDGYVVQGQSLEDVADGFANGTAEAFAETNDIEDPEAPIRVGTQLALPDDVWGTAPSITVNLGEGCTQWTISNADYEDIVGAAEPEVTPPAETSTDVEIVANGNDWTVTADGNTMPPNEGVVSILRGTTIDFSVNAGLHTITRAENGEETVVNDDFGVGDTDEITFDEIGDFEILCDFHPDMIAWVFVSDVGPGGATTTPAADATQTPTTGAGN